LLAQSFATGFSAVNFDSGSKFSMEIRAMQAALHLKTCVQSGGRIEINDPQLPDGKDVDVIVLFQPGGDGSRHSVVDVLARAPGHLAFQCALDVDAYVQEERQEWER